MREPEHEEWQAAITESQDMAVTAHDNGCPSRLRDAFEKAYAGFLAGKEKEWDEARLKFAGDPESLQCIDADQAYYEGEAKEDAFEFWLEHHILPAAALGETVTAAQLRGAKATRKKRILKQRAFIRIYREELSAHGSQHSKSGLIESAMTRFKAQHGRISARTAWKYVENIK